jgi:hypothetical protein
VSRTDNDKFKFVGNPRLLEKQKKICLKTKLNSITLENWTFFVRIVMLGYLKVNFLLYENELTFQDEATSFCCENGNVSLPKLQPFPPTLKGIWETANFKANIRSYNSSLGFTSLGYKKDDRLAPNGIFTFRIQGTMYHNMGNLIPQKDEVF